MLTHLPANTGGKVFNNNPVFSTNRRPIPAGRIQRGKKIKFSSIRNLKLKKSAVFYSLLKDLSYCLTVGLQIWFFLIKSILKTPLEVCPNFFRTSTSSKYLNKRTQSPKTLAGWISFFHYCKPSLFLSSTGSLTSWKWLQHQMAMTFNQANLLLWKSTFRLDLGPIIPHQGYCH